WAAVTVSGIRALYADHTFNLFSSNISVDSGGAVLHQRTGKTSRHFRASDSRDAATRKTGASANSGKYIAGARHRGRVSRQSGVRERIWRARCEHKVACRRGYGVSARVAVQADRLDDSCCAGRWRQNDVEL